MSWKEVIKQEPTRRERDTSLEELSDILFEYHKSNKYVNMVRNMYIKDPASALKHARFSVKSHEMEKKLDEFQEKYSHLF